MHDASRQHSQSRRESNERTFAAVSANNIHLQTLISKGLQLKKSQQKHNRFAVLDPEFLKRQTHVFNEQARMETKGPMEGGRYPTNRKILEGGSS